MTFQNWECFSWHLISITEEQMEENLFFPTALGKFHHIVCFSMTNTFEDDNFVPFVVAPW